MAIFYLIIGSIIISFSPILVKLIDLGPTWIGFWRSFLAFLVLFIFYLKNRSPFNRRFIKLTLFAGVAIGLDLFVWHRSILLSGAGLATVLGNTQVFYMTLFGVLYLNQPLTKKKIISVLVAFLGVLFICIDPQLEFNQNLPFYLGILFGLLTGVAYTFYLLTLRKIEIEYDNVSTFNKLMMVYLFCSVLLFFLSSANHEVTWPDLSQWKWLIALGIGVNIIGWKLISFGLGKVLPSTAGLVLLIQPIGSTLWGFLFFNEKLTINTYIGILFILMGIFLSQKK
ncbi:MAG: EamA family transporter [Bdellovibrionales bacterium]|nr:EamA family transporter [Bdellovibrionales bacterium]